MPDVAAVMDEGQRLMREIERARQAGELAEHPLYKESFEVVRSRLFEAWKTSPARDRESRENIWLMLKLLENVEGHLKELMETGKLASIQWEQKLSLAQRAKAALRGQW